MTISKLQKIILLFSVCFSITILSAQCPSIDILLSTQEDIDNFANNYPNCNSLTHSLTIEEASSGNILNLNGLSGITNIDLDLTIIRNSSLSNLNGLSNLTNVGRTVNIHFNEALVGLDGLNNLLNIDRFLVITQNNSLETLSGLNINNVGNGITISANSVLLNLEGLENIVNLEGDFRIQNNDALESYTGIENLESVGNNFFLSQPIPTNLDPFENLNFIGNDLYIVNHDNLTNIDGLSNVDGENIEKLVMVGNPLLSDCAIQSICNFLVFSNVQNGIASNAPGCNSAQEVRNNCLLGNEENNLSDIHIYPNPSSNFVTIKGLEEAIIVIYDDLGRMIKNMKVENSLLDISDLNPGLYFLSIKGDRSYSTLKFVKE